MFDIGFLEILLISVVALLILGPDKLPGAIRTMGLWIGRLRRNFDNLKRDIEKEIGADEIRRQLRNEAILEKFNESKKQITDGFGVIKKETEAVKDELNIKDQLTKNNDEKGNSESSNSDKNSKEKKPIDPALLSGKDEIIAPYPIDDSSPAASQTSDSLPVTDSTSEAEPEASEKTAPTKTAEQ